MHSQRAIPGQGQRSTQHWGRGQVRALRLLLETLEDRRLLSGSRLGFETRVAPAEQAALFAQSVAPLSSPAVAVHDDSSFAIAYTNHDEPLLGDEVYLRRFDSDRSPALEWSDVPPAAKSLALIVDDPDALRTVLVSVAREHGIDMAVQVNGLERRAKRLVVMDVDSTLIADEVIELLADEAGCRAEVEAVTTAAMAGELDFETSLRERVRRLAGLEVAALDRAAARIRLTPGARTFVSTLQRMGFSVAVVSGGFTAFTDRLKSDLGLDHAYANTLEIVDGRLTGEVVGPVVDRARKAELLREIAAAEGILPSQTVAIGDGANDLDMLATSGLGIAFNAKPAVRARADTTVSVPRLDVILFMLGVRGAEVDHVD